MLAPLMENDLLLKGILSQLTCYIFRTFAVVDFNVPLTGENPSPDIF